MPGAIVETAQDKKWQAESDMRTLEEADEIKKDKKRYSAAIKEGKEKLTSLKSVMGKAAADTFNVQKGVK